MYRSVMSLSNDSFVRTGTSVCAAADWVPAGEAASLLEELLALLASSAAVGALVAAATEEGPAVVEGAAMLPSAGGLGRGRSRSRNSGLRFFPLEGDGLCALRRRDGVKHGAIEREGRAYVAILDIVVV